MIEETAVIARFDAVQQVAIRRMDVVAEITAVLPNDGDRGPAKGIIPDISLCRAAVAPGKTPPQGVISEINGGAIFCVTGEACSQIPGIRSQVVAGQLTHRIVIEIADLRGCVITECGRARGQ